MRKSEDQVKHSSPKAKWGQALGGVGVGLLNNEVITLATLSD